VNQAAKFQKRIGERIRELRTERGVSQEAFAAQCSLHRTHMSLIERGRLNIGIITLKAVIDALGIKPSEFFAGME
jgi:transcriptional regulator with XRE-family HTH domain